MVAMFIGWCSTKFMVVFNIGNSPQKEAKRGQCELLNILKDESANFFNAHFK